MGHRRDGWEEGIHGGMTKREGGEARQGRGEEGKDRQG